MTRYILGRLGWSLASLWIFITVTFFAVSALPYDYASAAGFRCPACATQVREALGLTRPVLVQYLDFLGQLASGSLGESFSGEPVLQVLIGRPMWVTLLIFGVGAVVAFVLGAWLGRLAAWRASPIATGSLNSLAIGGFALFPPFLVFVLLRWSDAPLRSWRALIGVPADERFVWADPGVWDEVATMQLVGGTLLAATVIGLVVRAIARRRRWPRAVTVLAAPAAVLAAVASWALVGAWTEAMTLLFHAPRFSGSGFGGLVGGFQGAGGQGGGNVALAMIGFVILAFGEIVLVVEASMDAEAGEHYILTAQAKGLPDRVVRDRHAGRNAVLPALSRFVVGLPLLLTGLIIVERELEIPGLSTVFFDAAQAADLPLVTGTLVLFGVMTLAAKLVLEILLAGLDPRIRTAGAP